MGIRSSRTSPPCVRLSESTLYTILKRLEAAGLLAVRSAEHNGRLRTSGRSLWRSTASFPERRRVRTNREEFFASLRQRLAGSVRLSDLSAGTLTVETTTGDLNLRGVAVEGALSAHTTTGDIRLERVDAASLAIAATTGDVTGTLCSEKRFAVHTGTGDVSVPATASGGVCEIETSTGDVHIELA